MGIHSGRYPSAIWHHHWDSITWTFQLRGASHLDPCRRVSHLPLFAWTIILIRNKTKRSANLRSVFQPALSGRFKQTKNLVASSSFHSSKWMSPVHKRYTNEKRPKQQVAPKSLWRLQGSYHITCAIRSHERAWLPNPP